MCNLERQTYVNDVSDVYSPPRVVEHANAFGIKPGWSLDLTTYDTDGRPWDFEQPETRRRAKKRIEEEKPMFIIGSSMCTNFSILMNINWKKMHPDDAKRRWTNAVKKTYVILL